MAKSCLDEQEKFSVFIVDGLSSAEQAREIDEELRKVPGMIMSRTNFPTARYYGIYSSDSKLNKVWFEEFFRKYNIRLKCYSEGVRGVDPFVPITKETCQE